MRMNREKYQEYLRSPHWRNVKRRYYAKYGYYCKRCKWDKNLDLHHKTYKNLGHESLEDLESLCRRCHLMEHGLLREKKKGRIEFKILIAAVIVWVLVKMWFYGE